MRPTKTVHKPKRSPHGIRVEDELWTFVVHQAKSAGHGNASRLVEDWIREKRKAIGRHLNGGRAK